MVLGLVLAAPGCKRSRTHQASVSDDAGAPRDALADDRPEMIVLSRVELKTLGPSKRVEEGERAMALELARRLVESGLFVGAADQVPATHRGRSAHLEMTISYDVLTHDSGARAIMAAAQARLVWADGRDDSAPWEKLVSERDLSEGGPAPGAALEQAMADHVLVTSITAVDGLAIKEGVRTGDTSRVTDALDEQRYSGQTVLWALEIVRERRLASAFDAVVALLKSSDRDVRETAIGVLMALGDPRAVAPIADATDTADPVAVRIAIDAAAKLGGDDARTFLEFLRDHPSETIGDQAAEALEKLPAVHAQTEPAIP